MSVAYLFDSVEKPQKTAKARRRLVRGKKEKENLSQDLGPNARPVLAGERRRPELGQAG